MLRSGPAHGGCGPSGQTVPPSGSEPSWESGCGSELSHWGGQRQVLSAWVPVGCHLWLALGFLWAEPGARRAEGEPCERVRADPCIPLGRSQPAG